MTKGEGPEKVPDPFNSSADEMINNAENSNKILTWGLRAVGFVLMFFGLMMIFKPISTIADVLPIFGSIVSAGTTLITFLLAFILSLLTIAIGWIVYRPVLGIILLVVALALVMVIKGKLKSSKIVDLRITD